MDTSMNKQRFLSFFHWYEGHTKYTCTDLTFRNFLRCMYTYWLVRYSLMKVWVSSVGIAANTPPDAVHT